MRLFKLAFSLSLWVEPHLWVSEQRSVSGTEKLRNAINRITYYSPGSSSWKMFWVNLKGSRAGFFSFNILQVFLFLWRWRCFPLISWDPLTSRKFLVQWLPWYILTFLDLFYLLSSLVINISLSALLSWYNLGISRMSFSRMQIRNEILRKAIS